MINLVLSPSQQSNNECLHGDSEEDHMYDIALEVYKILEEYPELNILLIPKTTTSLADSVNISNQFIIKNGGTGYHLELHSDAGNYATGATGIYYSPNGKDFITPIYEEMRKITPWSDVGIVRRIDLYALKHTIAVAGLIEISFHDSKKESDWIHNNMNLISRSLAIGTCKALGVNPRTLVLPVLAFGATGESVSYLQKELNNMKYVLEVDGVFGMKTQRAVLQFQKSSGLISDGVVGVKTWGKLGV